jgi:hypothetical protein
MRVGATLSWPLNPNQSVKVAYSAGASTRTGADFDTFAVSWQILRIDRPRPTHSP